ncbi:MAG TPA: ABC transporter permease [Candidatus Binatia bacterium]|jgi:simple sugar transport system permease protein|nr:ABC transporter permease [Candidatus Binatia bacterium]
MGTAIVARLVVLVPPFLALVSAFAAVTLWLWLTGADALRVFSALLEGAGGNQYRLTETLVKACPLLYTGLAVALSLHAGVWNIGAEGQLLLGALATAWIGKYLTGLSPLLGLPLACGIALLAGSLWAGCAALLKNKRGVNEVISTIMLNFIAAGLVSYCVHGPLMEAGAQYPQTDLLPESARLPRLLPPTRLHLGVPLALLFAAGVWFFLFRTKGGFKLRATGANAVAARFAGIRVDRQLTLALVLSGALAGLAGGIEVSGVTQRVYEKFSPGYGYTAIAVALVGQRSPFGVVLAALFFGALEAGSGTVQRVAGVSSVLVSVIQATVVFFLAAYSTETVQQLLQRRRAYSKLLLMLTFYLLPAVSHSL